MRTKRLPQYDCGSQQYHASDALEAENGDVAAAATVPARCIAKVNEHAMSGQQESRQQRLKQNAPRQQAGLITALERVE